MAHKISVDRIEITGKNWISLYDKEEKLQAYLNLGHFVLIDKKESDSSDDYCIILRQPDDRNSIKIEFQKIERRDADFAAIATALASKD